MKEYPDNKLFNKRAYGLPEFQINTRRIRLRYSRHAIVRLEEYNAFAGMRYGEVEAPSMVDLQDIDIVEMETTPDGLPVKIVGRYAVDPKRDLVLIIVLRNSTVKTMWINVKDDHHNTLNKRGYDKP